MDWQDRIVDEMGCLVANVERHRALGGWIPLFTFDQETAVHRKKWMIEELYPVMCKWDKVGSCEITTITADDGNYGVKVMITPKSFKDC